MSSNAPARSSSISPPSSPTIAPAQPGNPSSGTTPAFGGTQSRTAAAQNVTSPPSSLPSRQNTAPGAQAPTRASTTQTFLTTDTSHNSSTQATLNPRGRKSSRPKYSFQRLHDAFSPSTHDLKEYDALMQGTSRPYDHRQQRKRLWLKTVTEMLMTLILCITYFLILYLYHLDTAIDKIHRRIFNALVTGNALFLGINLQASLKSYIKMLRWNILATRYRPLQIFDLILGSDSVTNVVKLFWHGRNKKHPFGLNLFTSTASLLALAWLIIQLGIAICVGLIGLTYNLDVNIYQVNTQTGNTSSIWLPSLLNEDWLPALARINTYGLKGDQIQPELSDTLSYSDDLDGNYLISDAGETRYYFVDENPQQNNVNSISHRYIDCNVNCTRSIVTAGQYGKSKQITITNDAGSNPINQTLYQAPGEGGMYVVANTNSTCGDRCTHVDVFQAAVTPDDADLYQVLYSVSIDQGTWFSCDVTVSDVFNNGGNPGSDYTIPPLVSRMLAGSFGWSANPLMNGKYLYQVYEVASELALEFVPEVGDMEQQIAEVTMDGIQSMDDQSTGIQRQYVPDGDQPVQAQILDVKWWAAATLLGAIPLVQFLTWIIVLSTANRVIIKDDSPLSMAKVYWTLLRDHLGEHGCMLDNNQLIAEVGKEKVVYGYRDGMGGSALKHVDVFGEGKGCEPARSFPQGEYDGPGEVRKRTSTSAREIDAREYF